MREFQIHSLASKKSAYDYIKALCQLTSTFRTLYLSTTDILIQNRYCEFLLAVRVWRALALQRRTGQAAITEIKRFYVQNGNVIPNSDSQIAGMSQFNQLSRD
jgi:hypothetical protein